MYRFVRLTRRLGSITLSTHGNFSKYCRLGFDFVEIDESRGARDQHAETDLHVR